MKKKYFLQALTIMIFLSFRIVYPQSNKITLKSIPRGTEGTTAFTDSSILSVSATGVVTYSNSNTTND